MKTQKIDPRAEYRLLQNERINASDRLDQKFPELKSLTVCLEYFDAAGLRRDGGMKVKPNLANAKSALYFNCRAGECIGGDYDLSEELSRAVAAKSKTVTGEKHCQGVRHSAKAKEGVPCRNLLRYELRLGYY
jgi:hypothetical protein